jgi:AraC-like DNA-binding protein
MANSHHLDGTAFLRLGSSPCVEVFAGDESESLRHILLQDELELRVVLRGEVDVGFDRGAHTAEAGTLLLLPARHLHAVTARPRGHSFIAFHLDDDALARFGQRAFDSLAARDFECIRVPAELLSLGLEAQSEIVTGATPTPPRGESLSRLLSDLIANLCAVPPRMTASGPATRVASIERALAHLREHFMQEISLQDLAAAAGLSKFHFVRLFAAAVGITPHRYQLLLRVNRARQLLRQGGEIADVAQRTGFFDQSHFTSCFRDVVGVTPGRYQVHMNSQRRVV